MERTGVAAVIPHWNRADLLRPLLLNLRHQTHPFDRIIVVDNGSTDDSVAVARGLGVEVVALPRNLGFAAAVNRGIKEASASEWVAILNNDVTLDPAWLATLLAAARPETSFAAGKVLAATERTAVSSVVRDSTPERTAVSSVVRDSTKEGTAVSSVVRDSTKERTAVSSVVPDPTIDGCFDEISRGACAWHCGSGRPDGPAWNRPRPIRIAPMTAALFRRSLFDEIGPLDEQFISYLEDVDFGLRCALAGRSGIYVPGAVAYHQGSSTFGRWNKDTVRLISRNQVLLTRKHFRGMPVWPQVAGQLLWGAVAIRHGRALSYFRGKLEGLWSAQAPCNAASPGGIARLAEIVGESERTILELQRETGFDSYWRAYFWLSRP